MLRHDRQTVAMALAEQLHHSVNRVERDEALRRQTTRASGEGEVHEKHDGLRAQERPHPGKRPEALEEVSEPQSAIRRHTGIGYELVLNPVVPQMAEQLVEVFSLPVEYISPLPAVSWSSAPVESITHVSAVVSSPLPVVEYLAPAPALSEAPAPGVEHISPAPAVFFFTRSSGGVYCTRACICLFACASEGVDCTRACSGFFSRAS